MKIFWAAKLVANLIIILGRIDPGHWIDFDLFGHQISAHYSPHEC